MIKGQEKAAVAAVVGSLMTIACTFIALDAEVVAAIQTILVTVGVWLVNNSK